jgi:hypothetical protein
VIHHVGRHARNGQHTRCRSDDDPKCTRRATRIAEWAAPGAPPFRLPVCRRHGRWKRRAGWRVIIAYQNELAAAADWLDNAPPPWGGDTAG